MWMDVIASVLITLVFFGLLYWRFKKRKIRFSLSTFVLYAVITAYLPPVILYLLEYIFHILGALPAQSTLSWAAAVILSLIANGFSFLLLERDLHFMASETAKAVLSRLTVLAAALFFCELLIGNASCFSPAIHHLTKTTLDYTRVSAVTLAESTGDGLALPAKQVATVTFSDVNVESRCIRLNMKNPTDFSNITVKITDDNFSQNAYTVYSGACSSAYPDSMVLDVCSSGKLKSLTISFNADSANSFQSVIINQPKEFSFHVLRYLLLFLLIASVYLVTALKLWKVIYNRNNSKHYALVITSCVLCVAMSMSVFGLFISNRDKNKGTFIQYPLPGGVSSYSPYAQQLDAFLKGQVNLDLPVDEKLAALDDPYDITLRQNISYSWDRAFYHLRYYSYYGVAPVLTVYYPLYLLTGKIAQDWLVCNIFSVLLTVSILCLLLQLVRWYVGAPNLLLLVLGIFSTFFVSLPLILQITSSFYCVPVLSALLNMTLFLNFALKGCRDRKFYYFLLSGVAFALMVASRPDYALTALIAVPLFLGVLTSRELSLQKRAVHAASFVIPVLVGGALIMWYNAIRFDSPLQFGAIYQLTVSDTAYNRLGVYDIFPTIYHYFLQPVNVSSQFPFLSPGTGNLGSYAHYAYITASIGVLAYPAILPVLATPFGMKRSGSGKEARVKNATLLCMLLTAVILPFIVYAFGGAIRQYTSDFMLLFALTAGLVLMQTECRARSRDDDFAQKLIVYLGALLLLVTIVQCIFLTFNCESFRLRTLAARFYYYVAAMFQC